MDTLQQRVEALEAALEQQVQASERERSRTRSDLSAMRRRLGATWACALVCVLGAFVLGLSPEARAQFGVTLTSLNNRLTMVEQKTAPLSVSGSNFTITGKNVQIVDGTGSTNSVSGLGNLTIGYNASRFPFGTDIRTGSHNLILGDENNYSAFGGLVAGYINSISGNYASVSGGIGNTASTFYASVSGGQGNTAGGSGGSSVSGGTNNTASGQNASVSGGVGNLASGFYTSVSGGGSNEARATGSSLSGGSGRGIIPFLGGPDFSYTWRAGNLTAGP